MKNYRTKHLLAALAVFALTTAGNAQTVGKEMLPDGVQIVHQVVGTGRQVDTSSVVQFYYLGRTTDAKPFNGWWTDRPAPAHVAVPYVQSCWKEAFPRLQVGETAEIHCPAATVLGGRGFYQADPPDTDVTFSIRIVSANAVGARTTDK